MSDRRQKDKNWCVTDVDGYLYTDMRDGCSIAVLMDIRDELKLNTAELRKLNGLLHCSNFTGIPTTLRSIRRKLPTPVPARRKAVQS